MSGVSNAVFLSYASQDTEVAQRICETLRAGGIEVWFDKSELRGGDAWDQSIRRQIKNCALFIPVISRNTHARAEGYFRLEWKLAVDRSHLIMANKAFLLPVVVDDTGDDDEHVPDKFRELQWTRLPAGETPPTFVERVQRLLSGGTAPAQNRIPVSGRVVTSPGRAPALDRHRRRKAVWYGGIAAPILLILGYLGIMRFNGAKPIVQSAASIAVLPLANESVEPSQQYFSDGISEDLITALGQFPGLKVIGRSSSFQFRDSKEGSRSIGAKLGVAHLLEGTVRKAGDMIRVSAELIDTADGTVQWSERYDRPYEDLFALQDQITRAVAQALHAKLLPGEYAAEQDDRPPNGNLEAYNAFLQGRFFRDRETEADLRKAIEYFTRATEIDSRYALAWCRLAQSWSGLGEGFLEGEAAQEAYGMARTAVARALSLAPNMAAVHIARGSLLQFTEFNWRGAQAEYQRAFELAPNDGSVKFALGLQLASLGKVEQAIGLTRAALTTEPLRAGWYFWLAGYLSGVSRLDEAEHAVRRAIELQPHAAIYQTQLAIIEIQRGRAQPALAVAQQVPPGWLQDITLGLARQIGGDRGAADASLKTLIDKDADGAAYEIAQVYALRNNAESTFAWLDRAWRQREGGVAGLLYDPFILRYKDDPRMAAFCKKVGLPTPAEAAAQNTGKST
jgi:TolB-like protein/Tfp pilus assembly protein PilF